MLKGGLPQPPLAYALALNGGHFLWALNCGNLWPEINCTVALTKDFLEPVSFVSTAQSSLLQTVGELVSHHQLH